MGSNCVHSGLHFLLCPLNFFGGRPKFIITLMKAFTVARQRPLLYLFEPGFLPLSPLGRILGKNAAADAIYKHSQLLHTSSIRTWVSEQWAPCMFLIDVLVCQTSCPLRTVHCVENCNLKQTSRLCIINFEYCWLMYFLFLLTVCGEEDRKWHARQTAWPWGDPATCHREESRVSSHLNPF